MRYLGFIPARGGSKGIPGKNLALLNGEPLIRYTVQSAFHSRLKASLFLSSDSEEIISYCKTLGLSSNYKRPEHLASDSSSTAEVIVHGLEHLAAQGTFPENIVLLQPTSPLRAAGEIDAAIDAYERSKATSLIGVSEMWEHPYECLSREGGDRWSFLAKPPRDATRRQDYGQKFFYVNGSIYIIRRETFLQLKKFIVEGETELFEMSAGNSIDIDEPLDLAMAEAYLRSQPL